ncbi:MAG: hypothetical protein QOJ12_818 [Thermoleophilales bacterium]|nr:hypothetical protein [Thermoleophilales bacterium]
MLVAFTVGLVLWIVMWSLGVKAFDAFLVTIALTLIAATAQIMSPFIKRLTRP